MNATAEAILSVADAMDAEAAPPSIPSVGFVEIRPDVYHLDPCAEPSLSSSIANKLVGKSPRHAYHAHPRLGGGRYEPTKSMDIGSAVHAVLLGGDIAVLDYANRRTKDAKAAERAARAAGRIPLLEHEHVKVCKAADAIREQLAGYGVELATPTARTELGAFWQSATTAGELVQCRALLDHLDVDGPANMLTDLKTTKDAHPQAVERAIQNYGYDLQRSAYLEAVEAILPELVGRLRWRWIFAEPYEPYAVTVCSASGELAALGNAKWRRAVDGWHACLRTDNWPSYSGYLPSVRVGAPAWAVARELGGEL